MTANTCAACDCTLDAKAIEVRIGSETLEVCSEECAEKSTAARMSATRRSVQTASGRVSYLEFGTGPVALFVHGVLLNAHVWRHQLAGLSDIRRCLAPDFLAHGET